MTKFKQKRANGTAEQDHPDRAPTGSAYHAVAQAKQMNQQKNSTNKDSWYKPKK